MRIAMGSPVKGFQLKQAVMKHLAARGHEILDVGCYATDRFITYTSVS